jgi:hypothetical protein
MPDTKITALTAIGANPIIPATFPIPMVDLTDTSMAASGTTKKVTVNQILGAGGTATLASATITGDLTVDTSTLKVDSANNRVGVLTATPGDTLDVNGRVTALRYLSSSSNAALPSFAVSAGNGAYNSGTNEIGFSINSTSAMTLNATGLGVGTSPAYKFQVRTTSDGVSQFMQRGGGTNNPYFRVSFIDATATTTIDASSGAGNPILTLATGGSDRLIIDSSGNVGIGVTPSAWASGYTALQNRQTSWFSTSARDLNLGANVYVDAVGYKYIATAAASSYVQYQGAHSWFNAPSGTAGNAITFTQAMTLDASGRLLVGTVTSGTAAGDGIVKLGTHGHCISQTGTSIASGSFVDLTISTAATGYQGFLSIANTQNSNANVRTQTTYSVFGRGSTATFTQIATADGPTGGASFTVTIPSNGVIRITNTLATFDTTISAQFFGGTSA